MRAAKVSWSTEGSSTQTRQLTERVRAGAKKGTEFKEVDVNQQENYYDCGIFALLTLQAIHDAARDEAAADAWPGLVREHVTQARAHAFRGELLQLIQSRS